MVCISDDLWLRTHEKFIRSMPLSYVAELNYLTSRIY